MSQFSVAAVGHFYIAANTTKWGTHKYMNMQLLNEMDNEAAYSAA